MFSRSERGGRGRTETDHMNIAEIRYCSFATTSSPLLVGAASLRSWQALHPSRGGGITTYAKAGGTGYSIPLRCLSVTTLQVETLSQTYIAAATRPVPCTRTARLTAARKGFAWQKTAAKRARATQQKSKADRKRASYGEHRRFCPVLARCG